MKSFRVFARRSAMFALGLLCALGAWGDSTSVTVSNAPLVTITGNSPQTMTFPVARSGDTNYPLWLNYQTVDGTAVAGADYTAATGPIKLAAGASSSGIPVTISGSTVNKSDRTLSLQLLGGIGVGADANFASAQTFATGKTPFVITQADLNGDGKPDLIVANTGSTNNVPVNTISILINNTPPGATTPTYLGQQTVPTGSSPVVAAPVDLNGDGKIDLVVPHSKDDMGNLSNTVSVLLNTTATGASSVTFAPKQEVSAGPGPAGVSTPDLNGDGRPDLVVSNNKDSIGNPGNTVTVLLNTTSPGMAASFGAPTTLTVGASPGANIVFDVNGDGKPDLVVANYTAAAGSTISVLLNQTAAGATTASFAAQQIFDGGVSPALLAAGDLNGDGKTDLIVSNLHASGFSLDVNTAGVLLNTTVPGSTASFAPPKSLGNGQSSFNVADVNGDGKLDLVGTDLFNNKVNVFLNNGAAGASTPSFAPMQTFTASGNPASVQILDLNGDGRPDVAYAGAGSNLVGVLLSTASAPATVLGASSYATQQTFATVMQPEAVVSADVNGDGRPDLIVANQGSNSVSVLLNTTAPGATAPSYAAQQPFTVGAGPQSVAVADVNGDGKRDLVVANTGANTISVLLNTTAPGAATPTFAIQPTFAAGTNPQSVAVGDFNGDGLPDVAVIGSAGAISVLLHAADASAATFGAAQPFTGGASGRSLIATDFNGDGRLDLVALSPSEGKALVLLNTTAPGATTATFTGVQTFNTGVNPYAVAAADIDGDGRRDLVVSNAGDATVSALLNTTVPGALTPSFAARQNFGTGTFPHGVAVADVDGDGKLDLLVANGSGNSVSVLRNATAAGVTTLSFPSHLDFPVGAGSTAMATADVNGDGRPDLVVANATDGNVSVLLSAQYVATAAGSATGTIHYNVPQTAATPNPTSLTFAAQVETTTSAAQQVTVTNTGTANLNISAVAFSGANSSDFAETDNCKAGAITPTSSCVINVTFTPGAPGSRSASLDISSNAPVNPTKVPVSGTGTAANFSIQAAGTSDFGTQPVGSTSSGHSFTITNKSDVSITVSNIVASGTNATDFAIVGGTDQCSGHLLAKDASCTVSFSFTPSAMGNRSGKQTVNTSHSGTTAVINLTGIGTQPAVTLTPAAFNFGNQLVNTTSATKDFTLGNSGNSPLTITSISTTASDFTLTSNTCPTSLAASASCTVTVSFTPAAAGSRTGSLSVMSNAASSPNTAALSGTGTQPGLSAPASASFTDQTVGTTSSPKAISVSNNGTAPLNVGTPSITGANAGDYAISGNTCSGPIAVNASCSISVTFTPGATGSRTATLGIPSDAPGSPKNVSLSGNGVTAPSYALQASGTTDFGSRLVSSPPSAAQTITITNTGTAATTVANVAKGGSNPGDFAVGTDNCTSHSLAVNGTCTISFTFKPAASGNRSASVTVNGGSNPAGTPANFTLTGVGTQPGLSVPATASFADQVIGTASAQKDVIITNSGNAGLNVGTPTILGANAADFSPLAGNTCTTTLAPNGTCKISIVFKPGAAGARSATLNIPSDAPTSPDHVTLSGNGVAANFSIQASGSTDFGNQPRNTASAAHVITITNNGNVAITVTGFTAGGSNPGDFAKSADNCTSQNLAPNASCTVSFSFTPAANGSRSASELVGTNHAGTSTSFPLTGVGTEPGIGLNPTSLVFDNQSVGTTSAAKTVTLSNSGNSPLTITSISASGDFAQTNNCPATLAASANCTINITFAPIAAGSRSGSIAVMSNAPSSPDSVSLSGTGVALPALSATPASASFGNQLVGSTSTAKDIVIKNVGTAGLDVGTPAIAGTNASDFSVSGNTCTTTIAPNGTCKISVTFMPGSTGTRSATLGIPSNDPASPASVNLSGVGTQPALSVTPGSLTFPDQGTNTASTAKQLTVKNTGTAPLHVTGPTVHGANAGDFAVSGNTCTGAIAPNATCSISVTFTPVALGARSATLNIPSDDPASPATANLSGNGVQPPSGGGGGSLNPWLLLVLGGAWFARRKRSWISAQY